MQHNPSKPAQLQKSAMVALAGMPNVGKSTLINTLLGHKLSIISHHAHTTRRRAVGICYQQQTQLVICDTPGLAESMPNAMHRAMQMQLIETIQAADILVWIVRADKATTSQKGLNHLLENYQLKIPLILVINQIDKLVNGKLILPLLKQIQHQCASTKPAELVPVSALRGTNVDRLKHVLASYAPHDCWIYENNQQEQQSKTFYYAEVIREKILWQTRSEVPHQIGVSIETMHTDSKGTVHINALVTVEKPGHKMIILGKGGRAIKNAGTKARIELEKCLNSKVMLKLFVQLRPGWRNDPSKLTQTGYGM